MTTLRECIETALTRALTDTAQTSIPTTAAVVETAVLDLYSPPFTFRPQEAPSVRAGRNADASFTNIVKLM